MAADNSPLRMQPIALTAFIGILVLIGLKFIFDSYYVTMFEEEEYRKVGSVQPTELLALRAAEAKSFASAPVPLDKAMQLVSKGRADPALKNGSIMPEPSNDRAAMVGWAQIAKADMVTDTDETPAVPSAGPATSSSASPTGSVSAAPGAPSAAPAGSSAASPSARPSAAPASSGAVPAHP